VSLLAALSLTASAVLSAALVALPATNAFAQAEIVPQVKHDTSAVPLRDTPPRPPAPASKEESKDKRTRGMPQHPGGQRDTAVQGTATATGAPTAAGSFDGVGNGFTGPAGTFTVNSAPPDTDSAVGSTQVVEVVNSGFAIFDKTSHAVTYGPAATNTLFAGFGGSCESTNDGDAVVRYDRAAGRWIIAQFANASSSSGPYLECVAVSQTSDATGSYHRYSFDFGTTFPDYPKLSVWPDAYYMTYNLFNGNSFAGARACAMDRAAMLSGAANAQQCFTTSTAYGGLLAADNDGATAPPSGAANTLVALGASGSTLASWKFHVDWSTPASSTFSGPTTLPVAGYSVACGGGGACIPQSGTKNRLDSLADRLMY